MAVDPNLYYRTIAEADDYFADQLFASDWTNASDDDKGKALLAATRAVDQLRFSGVKKTVYDLLQSNPNASDAAIQAAYDSQTLQFPRDTQTVATVPDRVFYAVCEEARELLTGRDPQQEYRNLELTSDGVGSSRVSSDRSTVGPDHTVHGLVSPTAWKLLREYLTPDGRSFSYKRV